MDGNHQGQDCSGVCSRPFRVGGPWSQFLDRVSDTYAKRIPEIREKLGSYIGTEIDGKQITLSGLVGIVSAGGMRGAKKWLDVPGDRTKYPQTTSIFNQTNGIF